MPKLLFPVGFKVWSFIVTSEPFTADKRTNYWCLCLVCKGETTVSYSQLKTGTKKTCCAKKPKDISGQRFGRLVAKSRSGTNINGASLWSCTCDCGNHTNVVLYSLRSGETRSCGCLTREVASSRRGPKSPRWNFNLSIEDREKARPGSIGLWSVEVKIRDAFTCQVCHQVGGHLESHHLNAYRDFPEQRTKINNGVCLCATCHREFHFVYGKGGNTRKDFRAWLLGLKHV